MGTTNFPNGITSTTGFNGTLTGEVVATKLVKPTPVVTTADKTLTAAESGSLIYANAESLTITLPSASAGLEYTVVTNVPSATTGTVIALNGSDTIDGLGVESGDGLNNSPASDAAGDFVELLGYTGGWYVAASRGTWVSFP